ncbi:MAG: hypothetical protein ABIH65_00050 [Nanoarchaeota archaeon]
MGYWEEKKKYEEAKVSRPQTLQGALVNCTFCGKHLPMKNGSLEFFRCQNTFHLFGKGMFICKDCATKCKKCGKYFCPKHINNHKCKK